MSNFLPLPEFPLNFITRHEHDKERKESLRLQSLWLDTAVQNDQRRSRPMLFRLLAEIPAESIDFVEDDKDSLAELARVSSDNRKLGYERQLKEIHFNYSPEPRELFWRMATESLDDKGETKPSFPIGVCVRKVTFAPVWDLYNNSPRQLYKDLFFTVIASKMPNLDVLVWKDQAELENDFIEAISRCSAKHVKLERIEIGKSWLMRPPLTAVPWDLCSLDLDVNLAVVAGDASYSEVDAPVTIAMDDHRSAFFNTLFQRCSSTLESLTWSHKACLKNIARVTLDASNLTFTSLQCLRLTHVSFEPKLFSLFLSPLLRHLEMPRRSLDLISKSLETCEPLQQLQTLVVPELPSTREGCMPVAEFIKRHNHVRKLQLTEDDTSPAKDNQLSSLIIPILADGGFDNLCCLSLSWSGGSLSGGMKVNEDDIPEASLVALSTIASLKQLSLRVGRCDWLIDHDKLRHHLKGLNCLETLALLHDTYYCPELEDIPPAEYYDERIAIDSDHEDAKARPHLDADADYGLEFIEIPIGDDRELDPDDFQYVVVEQDTILGVFRQCPEAEKRTWERSHRNRMLTQAEAYAEVLTALEWIYCGQRLMGLSPRIGEDGVVRKEAIPLTQERDECRAFLNKTFGIEERGAGRWCLRAKWAGTCGVFF